MAMRGERSMRSNSLEVPVFSREVGNDGGAAAEDMEGVKMGARKRGMSMHGLSGGEKMPSLQCRSVKKTPPTAAHVIKAHQHHRSPSLHAVSTECSSSVRALRQSVSFSVGTTSSPTPRPKPARQNSIPRRVADAATFCLDNNVQVLIRSRPVNDTEIALQASRCVRQENAQTISWLGQAETRFTFDHVAGEFVTQDEVFRMVGLPMVDNCLAGYNSCVFAYGQTGSGKTHTMLGDVADLENRGMTPRVFENLFEKIRKEEEVQKQRNLRYKCRCSFLEIYNEQIADLLEPASTSLQMREDSKKGVFVEGLLEVEVRNVEDVLNLLVLGAANRKVAATNMNRESSRSHSVFTCVVESQWECDSMVNFRFGRLNLVDLAGSERYKDTGVDEERLREAAGINKSLSTLGLVIMVLVDIANGKQRHVPYRDSKLTFLLQDSLGGNSKSTIIANISPSSCASSETLSTLKFAQRAKFIQNNAVINEELTFGDVKGLQEEIHQLKDELTRVRRQSVSRILPEPERKDASDSTHDAKEGWSRSEGSFLQFGRGAVPSPTVLNHKVKQREDESYHHKAKTLQETREREAHSEDCSVEKRPSLQACEKRETMMVRKTLLDMLDRNISIEGAAAHPQHETLLAESAAARQKAEHFRNEIESHERSLSECRTKLQISLESNERIASELDALRLELEGLNEECRKHKQVLATLRLKNALEINCLELKQARHHNVELELKTQLQKSEEKAEQEKFRRNQTEVLLQEALQESTNLQTELQWTRDSLEGAEAVMENFQDLAYHSCPKHEMSSLEDPWFAKEKRKIKHQEAILQLQMELATIDSPDGTTVGSKWEESPGAIHTEALEREGPYLTEEKVSAGQLQEINKHYITPQESLKERLLHAQVLATSSDYLKLQEVSEIMLMTRCPDTCNIIHEAVLQPCQHMEVIKKNLEARSVNPREVGQKPAHILETASFRHEELTKRQNLGDEKEVLEMQVRSVLDHALLGLNTTEAQVHEALYKHKGESLAKKQSDVAREQALVEAEQRCIFSEAARLKLEEEYSNLQHQIQMKEEEISRLKEQGAPDRSSWVSLENPDLQVALREPEECFVEENQVITNLAKVMLERLDNSENETEILGAFATTEEARQLTLQIETQDCSILKAMMLNLDKENADLQHQLLETEAGSTALKSTIANLQGELQERSEEVGALATQLHVSDRHIFELKCQNVELRDAMQRQGVAFGALYEQLQKQESSQEEKACLKKAERYQARTRNLKSQVETLQFELEKLQPLRNEMALIYEELHTSRGSSAMAIQETERLQEEVKRKQCAIEALEEHLLKCEQSKLQCQEELQRCGHEAEEKQVEVEILAKTVEELESTVYALESQVGLLTREGERQCSVGETMERELQELRQQNVNLLAALSQKISARVGNEVRCATSTERKLEEREADTQSLPKKHQTNPQRKMSPSQTKGVQKEKKMNPKGSLGSAFRWFQTNHGQVHSELDEERKAHERHIQELENALEKRQLEIIALQKKLADAERVTRDVLLVLRGVKVDMANAATLVEKQQVEDAHVRSNKHTLQKDEEVGRMFNQLNNFIEERESWLEIISRKQAELIAAHMSMEKLREHEKALVAENKKFKNENQMQVNRIKQLEQEARTVSGRQIKHHVKVKDENNALRIQNSELGAKLRRLEHANTRISAELAKYLIAEGRSPLVNIDEEQRLRTKLKEAQKRSSEADTALASFSARVIKATEMKFDCNITAGSPSVGVEAIEEMRIRLETVQLELDDFKLKTKIVEEKQRIRKMRKTTHD